ncbi:hypothetical protein ACH5RR_002531 [Cinchona calisaya]|uniref:Scarecrow-like protein 9 n=1 Tax=Cinchona calisaya TaxID=153742 RepID=A0ABD3AS99_9GENT
MDPAFLGIPDPANGFQLRNQKLSTFGDTNLSEPGFEPLLNHDGPTNESSNLTSATSSVGVEDDFGEDLDFSDAVLRYINRMLMEEDMEDKTYMLQESLDFQAKEKSFYDALGKEYPPSPDPANQCNLTSTSSSNGGSYVADPADYDSTSPCFRAHHHRASNNPATAFLDSPISPPESSCQSIWNFKKGVEEAKKFLPDGNKLLNFRLFPLEGIDEEGLLVKEEERREGSRRRKNPHSGDTDLEERSSKQAAVYTDSTVRSEEFDIVLLHSMGKGEAVLAAYRENLRSAKSNHDGQLKLKRSSGGKGRGKKQNNGKKEVIDLRTLMIHCAQAVAADDRRSANELLKQIRQHASLFGDGNQRLAYCFADGLEARIAGTGSQIYKALINKRTPASDFLKAYHLYLASCPFTKISSFASNKTIMIKSKNAMRVHVIDFGILYGFQWPTFIQRIAGREGGPPKIRITGVDFPQPGFRPAERIEETGHRLAEYAKMFNVPFEYNAVAKKWETIKLEDLKIEEGEFVVVNCIYRSKNLLDETLAAESSRTIVLKLIRSINPDIFIHGIVNGAYSAPFFVTRFREALFHFSALFDMLETIVPREIPERTLIEKEIFGREALNVIACEGWERVERPETYKQWQVRNMRAGFRQIPLEREIMKRAIEKVTSSYHKDFIIDEDSQWLLLGWKGRIIYALSCWTPI